MKKDHWLLQKKIVHRGLWDEQHPENSLGAFERAIAAGHPIELDVQMLRDGTLVVFHDRSMRRMMGQNAILTSCSYEEIKNMRICNSQYGIPQLSDALGLVNGRVPLLIEIKKRTWHRKKYIQCIVEKLKKYNGQCAVASFDPFLVKMMKKRLSHMLCGQHFSDYADDNKILGWVKKQSMFFLWHIGGVMPDFFICRASLLPKCWVVQYAHKKNRAMLTWHVTNQKEYEKINDVINNEICDPHRL